jgi:Protein of unknown function (DUF3025)
VAQDIAAIDWTAPWLQAWRARGQPLAKAVATGLSCAQALNLFAEQVPTCPVRFVPQSELPPGQAYEAFIFATQQVPTRDGLHDFFNGLCWLHFPHTKQRLNRLQAAQIAHSGIAPVRGPARDALTVFDENAALLHAPEAVWDALVQKDWRTLFGPLRPAWKEARLQLFGHALLEKLVHPRIAITAHVYHVECDVGAQGDWDGWLGAHLQADALAEKPFAHLPVLGVPGWWPANEVPGFYDDVSVFRPPRLAPA